MHIPVGHQKNVFPTVQFITADDVLDGVVPMVELISGGNVLDEGAKLGGSMLAGGAELESGIPDRTLSYVELG